MEDWNLTPLMKKCAGLKIPQDNKTKTRHDLKKKGQAFKPRLPPDPLFPPVLHYKNDYQSESKGRKKNKENGIDRLSLTLCPDAPCSC